MMDHEMSVNISNTRRLIPHKIYMRNCSRNNKFGFAEILLLTVPFQRLYVDIGFALKPFYVVLVLWIFTKAAKLAAGRSVNSQSILVTNGSPNTFLLIFWFVFSIFVVTLLNGAHEVSFRHIIVFLIVVTAAFLLSSDIVANRDLDRLIRLFLRIGFFLGILGIFFYALFFIRPDLNVGILEGVTHDDEMPWTLPMLQSVDVGSNAYGMTIIPFLFSALFLSRSAEERSVRLYAMIISFLLMANLLMTFSRGSIVSFLASSLFYVLFIMKNKKMRFMIVMGILCMVLFFWSWLMELYTVYSILKGATSLHASGVNLFSSRDELFAAAWDVFLRNPFLGIGQGVISDPAYVGKQAHNTYIELLAENGIVPFIVFMAVLISVFFRVYRVYKRHLHYGQYESFFTSVVLGMIGTLVGAIVSSAITIAILWVQIAILLALCIIFENGRNKENRSVHLLQATQYSP